MIVPLIDARRNRVYVGAYTLDEGLREVLSPRIMDINELMTYLNDYDNIVFTGDGHRVYRDIIEDSLRGKYRMATLGQDFARAVSIGELAIEKYSRGIEDDYFSLAPEYLNLSQAERELKERKNGK